MKLDQYVIVDRSRLCHLFELKNCRRSVSRAYNRFHYHVPPLSLSYRWPMTSPRARNLGTFIPVSSQR